MDKREKNGERMKDDSLFGVNSTQIKGHALLLEDGTLFEGHLYAHGSGPKGSKADAFGYGEVVFNTAMAGYQEVLTDPSYTEQVVVMTYPHQGNYGINPTDNESLGGPKLSGFVVHELCESPSNFESEMSLPDYLKKYEVPTLTGVDTRALTLKLRSSGVLRGFILNREQAEKLALSSSLRAQYFSSAPSFEGRDLIREISTKKPYWFNEKGQAMVVAIDYGVKLNLLRELSQRDLRVMVVPATMPASEILALNPAGVFLSNGPGDPAAAGYAIETIRQLLGKRPLFGVCMGHQLLGLALGGRTFKMKFGHRGVNQPVLNLKEGKVEISSHNHGFAVDAASLPKSVKVTHENLNDQVCEGLEDQAQNCFSVQYHPESAPGPHDSSYLFDRFASDLHRNSTPRSAPLS